MKKRVLAWIYDRYITDIKALQAERVKSRWIENTDFAFELEGKKYLKFRSATDLPLPRLERMQVALIQLENRLTRAELSTLIEIAENALNNAVNTIKTKQKIENIQTAYWVFQEIKSRQTDLMFHPELLCELAALTIIEESEDATVIDENVHKAKVELFMRQGGTADFFTRAGVISLFPNPELLLQKSVELWEMHLNQVNLSKRTYDTILGEINASHG